MNAPSDNVALRGLRGWWAASPRPGVQRLINPWEYRHLRASGVTRIASGFVAATAATAGVVCLLYALYGWAAFFLVLGVLNLAGGYWYITVARSAPPRAWVRLQWSDLGVSARKQTQPAGGRLVGHPAGWAATG